jgi:hypothetical protein
LLEVAHMLMALNTLPIEVNLTCGLHVHVSAEASQSACCGRCKPCMMPCAGTRRLTDEIPTAKSTSHHICATAGSLVSQVAPASKPARRHEHGSSKAAEHWRPEHALALAHLFQELQPAMDQLVPQQRREDDNTYAVDLQVGKVRHLCIPSGTSGRW